MVLFCAGLAVTGRVWWERVLWGLLAAISLVWAVPSLKLPGFREGGSP
jgi:hypothetical protein